MDEVIKEFLVESFESLDRLDQDFVHMEKNPEDRKVLDSIFRTVHTIKGTGGFLGLKKLEAVAHIGENVLGRLREGDLLFTPEIASVLLSMLDAIRTILNHIQSEENEGEESYPDLIQKLTEIYKSQNKGGPAPIPVPPANQTPAVVETPPPPSTPVEKEPPQPETPPTPPQSQEVEKEEIQEKPVSQKKQAEAESSQDKSKSVSDNSIRVDVNLLDKLMNLVGELVLARNQILQFMSNETDNQRINATQRLNLITTELQEGVMKTRMQPIENVWNKFPRVVRDLSVTCKKKVRLEMIGKETDLDKTILEAIRDPLTHIIRNSVDHGVETPDVRKAAGKPEEGVIILKAYHEGGQVNIEISDDGGGINPEKVGSVALKKGLITKEQMSQMNERELINLIFLPGFSTAEKISNISGRGVGMDVVKTNIEKIGGTVDLQSKLGEGSTIKIKIPLTLAIIPALMVTVDGDRYAIPQVSLLELVRVEGNNPDNRVEMIKGCPVYRLREKLLPLVYLRKELKLEPEPSSENTVVNIVVLQADERQFGLVVDIINDTEEIVVKPLAKQLKGISCFAGATIQGDGRVALILDVMGLAQQAHVISELHEHGVLEKAVQDDTQRIDSQTMLVFKVDQEGQMALPLSTVSRLEEFPTKHIEHSGKHEVVQYRDMILPIIRLTQIFGKEISNSQENLQVVVYSERGHTIGLVVDQILDIVQEHVEVEKHTHRPGIRGSAVIQHKVTDIVDIQEVIQHHYPAFFENNLFHN